MKKVLYFCIFAIFIGCKADELFVMQSYKNYKLVHSVTDLGVAQNSNTFIIDTSSMEVFELDSAYSCFMDSTGLVYYATDVSKASSEWFISIKKDGNSTEYDYSTIHKPDSQTFEPNSIYKIKEGRWIYWKSQAETEVLEDSAGSYYITYPGLIGVKYKYRVDSLFASQ